MRKDEVHSHTRLLCGLDPILGENVKKTRLDRQRVLSKAERVLMGSEVTPPAEEGFRGDIGKGKNMEALISPVHSTYLYTRALLLALKAGQEQKERPNLAAPSTVQQHTEG